ncbi:unnamed protein product [Pleuronectes platessa]|uniref:Uncharacterized protein n=1 Tax=Pleuronectes platessa TaxID=8262 RepID=A0A9N7Y5T2_PLEPL|nr:unnamed protein product [Pleuronectes platessa]
MKECVIAASCSRCILGIGDCLYIMSRLLLLYRLRPSPGCSHLFLLVWRSRTDNLLLHKHRLHNMYTNHVFLFISVLEAANSPAGNQTADRAHAHALIGARSGAKRGQGNVLGAPAQRQLHHACCTRTHSLSLTHAQTHTHAKVDKPQQTLCLVHAPDQIKDRSLVRVRQVEFRGSALTCTQRPQEESRPHGHAPRPHVLYSPASPRRSARSSSHIDGAETRQDPQQGPGSGACVITSRPARR